MQAGAGGQDLVSRLLNARDEDTGEPIDVQQVRDEALIFLLAGYETTSTALTFALHLLGRHPSEQARIHDELDAVMGAGRRPRPTCPRCGTPRWRSRRRCACTRPAFAIGRRAEAETEIGGYVIPAGSDVLVSQYATHRC